MKSKIVSFSFLLLFSFTSIFSQITERLNYQAIVRNSSHEPITEQQVSFRFSIINAGGTTIYSGTQSTTTSELGLVVLLIGEANPAVFGAIDWSQGGYSLKVECDPSGGSSYTINETTILNPVPYALYGRDEDADPANEMQSLSLSGNELSISGTNSVTLAEQVSPWLYSTSDIYFNSGKVGIGTDAPEESLDVSGSAIFRGAVFTGSPNIEVNEYGAGNRFSFIDFHGDDTNEDFSLRLIRYNTGIDAVSRLHHKGIGPLQLYTENLAPIDFYTSTTLRMRIDQFGRVGIGTDAPLARLSVQINPLPSTADSKVDMIRLVGDSGNSDNLYISHRRHSDGTNWNSSEIRIQKQVDATQMHYIAFKGLPSNDTQLEFGNNNTPYMTISKVGRVGIGTTTPTRTLDVNGNANFVSDIALWRNNKALNIRQDDNNTFILNMGDFMGNGSDNNGSLVLGGQAGMQFRYGLGAGTGIVGMTLTGMGKLGIGTSFPTGKLQVDGGGSWSDEEPLFEVRNKYGDPVFSVYNNGVRINIEDDETKGPRGGFAIGGFDRNKGAPTVDFMRISPDSIRFNINNDPTAKGPRGGFAIGGFDRNKGEINEDFMYITPGQSTTGQYNTFMGYQAGLNNAGGFRNVFLGYGAGATNSTGSNNQCVGAGSGYSLSNGAANIFVGTSSGSKISTGDFNIVMGNYGGQGMGPNDSYNIILGNFAGWYAPIGDRKLFIDCDAVTNPLIYGNFAANVVRIYGDLEYTGALNHVSDIALKTNFSKVEDVLPKLLSINSYYFDWNSEAIEKMSVSDTRQLGVIAQEVEKEFPELVTVNDKGYKTVNYLNLTPILLQATKEQQSIIDSQEDRITQLENKLMEIELLMSTLLEQQK